MCCASSHIINHVAEMYLLLFYMCLFGIQNGPFRLTEGTVLHYAAYQFPASTPHFLHTRSVLI